MKNRFTPSIAATLLPTLLGLGLMLLIPVWSLWRIEHLHSRIENDIVPAREHIERAAIRAHAMRAAASDFIANLDESAEARYKRHRQSWRDTTQTALVDALHNAELSAVWGSALRDMEAWIQTAGDLNMRDGESMSTPAGFRLFEQSTTEMQAAETNLDRMEAEARGQVREWEQGAIAATGGMGVLCALLLLFSWRNAIALHDALAASSRSAERLEAAVKETNHRVKNNLQTIGALIDMNRQEYGTQIPARVLEDIAQQVKTVAAVHDFLSHESRANQVAARPMLEKLIALTTSAQHIKAEVNADAISLPVKQATSVALIANELALNAGKHGAKCIQVTFCVQEAQVVLSVCDDGPGLPLNFTVATHGNLGTGLVETLARHDLGGEVIWGNEPELGGAEIKIRFPVTEAD